MEGRGREGEIERGHRGGREGGRYIHSKKLFVTLTYFLSFEMRHYLYRRIYSDNTTIIIIWTRTDCMPNSHNAKSHKI